MNRITLAGLLAALAVLSSCTMKNPLLTESPLPYGAPQFDKIKAVHYIPAFEKAIAEAKAEIDAIARNPEEADFRNTIEAMEYSGSLLNRVSGIFYNVKEADTNDDLEEIALKVAPMMTEYSMYVSLNEDLFRRIKAVYDKRESLGLTTEQSRLLDKTYKGFVRGGALLGDEDKKTYSKYAEELSLLVLQFSKNSLASANGFKLHLTDEAELAGLPDYVREMGAATAAELGREGWTFDLSAPSYSAFMKFSERRDLREKLCVAYGTKAVGGEFDNTGICRSIIDLRIKMSKLLGYDNYAQYVLEERMAKDVPGVYAFLDKLLQPSLPAALKEVDTVFEYARANGFEGERLEAWDFSYWSEKYRSEKYELSDAMLKPYFRLEDCIDAVFGLATRLYGISFEERSDIPGYHPDVHVYDVKDADGSHLALFYADFFPRPSKRGGAWMTEFRGQSIKDGVESRPLVSIVTNFSKPTENAPSLLTHSELTTFLHEFGHSLHGMLARGTYESLCGTNVNHDFVELPSQIMENWGYEKDFLKPFARHYQTGEEIPDEFITKLAESQNYNSAYLQMRQLGFGLLDMAWHTLTELPAEGTVEFEKKAMAPASVLASVDGGCMSTTFTHIFSGGYAAGYYSYKWAEVLEADAFSLFSEKGIFNPEVAASFRHNVLEMGSREDESVLYRRFRGHDPEPEALLVKLGIISAKD